MLIRWHVLHYVLQYCVLDNLLLEELLKRLFLFSFIESANKVLHSWLGIPGFQLFCFHCANTEIRASVVTVVLHFHLKNQRNDHTLSKLSMEACHKLVTFTLFVKRQTLYCLVPFRYINLIV